jgi:signal transduction histidine kinase
MQRPALGRGLSGKILLLTVVFVLLGEVLIYLPSIARFRLVFLTERIDAAYLATIALDMEGASRLDRATKMTLLREAGSFSITLHRPQAQLMLGRDRPVQATVDLRERTPATLIPDAIRTLLAGGSRTLRVIGYAHEPDQTVVVDIVLPEARLWSEMVDYSIRILTLSVVLSIGVALLLLISLQLLMVRPLRRITAELAAFRDRPEDATADLSPSSRTDEIGVVERELAGMRLGLRRALQEQTRLAALGAAVGRMSHDLRNLLATAVLVSDRLEASPDPEVRRVGSRLIETLDRAIRLCAATLDYASSRPEPPTPRRLRLVELIERVRGTLAERREPVRWHVEVDPRLDLVADPDQLHRVLLNLARNAYDAMGERGGELTFKAESAEQEVRLTVSDTGPGIPPRIRERLFEPFAGSTKPGGSGLGLAICRELLRAQGGEIELRATSQQGTIFELYLPARAPRRDGSLRSQMMTANRSSLLLMLALGACAGPSLGGYDGLQYKVVSFYEANALEKNAACPQPRMTPVKATVVEETPERVVMNVRYHWWDERQNDSFPLGNATGTGSFGYCNDWSERTFTLAKNTGGGLDVVSMTGPQRQRGRAS